MCVVFPFLSFPTLVLISPLVTNLPFCLQVANACSSNTSFVSLSSELTWLVRARVFLGAPMKRYDVVVVSATCLMLSRASPSLPTCNRHRVPTSEVAYYLFQ